MFVERFLARFRKFYFLTHTEYFAWAITFAMWPFLVIFKTLLFFEYLLVFLAVFCKEQLVFVETFFACFRRFYFFTQTEYFAWAIAFALWPFLAILKMFSFFENELFFRAVFLRRKTLMCFYKRFSRVLVIFIF